MKEKTIKINDNVTVIITRMGQCDPGISDDVQVRGEVRLAARSGGSYLHETLRFGGRVDMLGESLISTWGTPDNHPATYRARHRMYTAMTWKKAFDKAEKALMAEVDRLIQAITTRKAALEAAEL